MKVKDIPRWLGRLGKAILYGVWAFFDPPNALHQVREEELLQRNHPSEGQ